MGLPYKKFRNWIFKKNLQETNPQSVGSYVSKEAAPIAPTPHNEKMREISPESATKGLAEQSSTLGEHLGDRVSKPGVGEVRPHKVVKVTHKKFSIEDVNTSKSSPLEEKIKDVTSEISSEAGSDSEDEAPETVTASAGFDHARTAVLEAAKVAAK